MAAPAVAQFARYGFRDARGQTSRVAVLVGGATSAVVQTNIVTLVAKFQALSNAHVYDITLADTKDHTYGTAAVYQDVEDKAVLVYTDSVGGIHKYQVPAPIAAAFLADGETIDKTNGAVSGLNTSMQSFVYGNANDTAAVVFVGGFRARRKFQKRTNIFTLDPTETNPEGA